MKIIKEQDTSHEVFKDFSPEENVLEIFRFEEPSGFMVIRRGKTFVVKISSKEDFEVNDDLEKILNPYFKSEVYMILDANLTNFENHITNKGFKTWFGYYDMSLTQYNKEMQVGCLKGYLGNDKEYNRILGKAFEPMRTLHGFEPYDWYGENPEEAYKEYKEAEEQDKFYSYEVDGRLIGVGMVIDNMIDVIAIDPKLQKCGHGREFLKGILCDLFKKGHQEIKIGVVESNDYVYRLYSSEGFITDCHKRMYKNY
ncbi:MAG: GNAT family N-acetyltransferase [Clostridiales bacterium]|nr:GNAT family N-acetyltransferase [Clostridiales bacterium]